MHVRFEMLADHSNGVADAVVRVHDKFVRKDVKNFTIFGKGDVARGVHGSLHVVAFDVARTIAERDAAAAVNAANVVAGDADEGGFNGNAGDGFGFFDGAANGTDGGIKIDDEPLAEAFRFRRAERQKFHLLFDNFGHEHAGFRTADVQAYDVFILLRQAAAPPEKLPTSTSSSPLCAPRNRTNPD